MVKLKPDMNSVARVRGYVVVPKPSISGIIITRQNHHPGLRNIGFPEEVAAQQ